MAQANSVPTPNYALRRRGAAIHDPKSRRITIKPADRRYFIGGSDARIIMGQ